jgi:tRNA (guanine-N7-)-methyltransferase
VTVRRSPRLPLDQLAPFLLAASDLPVPLDWHAVFGNDHPVELEVGFGKGLFLVNAALASPQINFVGVEIERKYQLFTANRIAKRGLTNVRLVCADARLHLRDAVAPGSLQKVHVYFPDPWWKKRHHKRRVFTAEFVGSCARVLRLGGRLEVATDVEEYFQIIRELLAQQLLLRSVPVSESAQPKHDMDYLTNFERKSLQRGTPVYRGRYVRVESPLQAEDQGDASDVH